MGAVRRRPLASLVLLGALLAGCSHHSSGGAGPPTSRTGGAEGPTTSTAPAFPSALVSAWFGSDHDGWAVSHEPCPQPGTNEQARCAVVWKTADAGGSWTRLARLDLPPDNEVGPDFVSAVRFADDQHGWVFDRSLWATFSGGKRWQPVDLGNPVVALESTSSQMFALVGACGNGAGNCPSPMRIYEGTVSTGRWRFVAPGFDLPNTDKGTLVVTRTGPYAVASDYGSNQMFLARAAGRWERRTPPCLRPIVAPITGEDGLVAACLPAMTGSPVELQTSSDGGRSWAVVWQYAFTDTVTSLAVTGQAAVVTLQNGALLRTTDNGMHFTSVLRAGARPQVQFVDGEHGFVSAGPDGGRQLFRTADGGATWTAVAPPR